MEVQVWVLAGLGPGKKDPTADFLLCPYLVEGMS